MFRQSRKDEGSSRRGPDKPVFLGTLRSEFDEPEALPEGFALLQTLFEEALEKYTEGILDKHSLALRLRSLRCRDSNGGEWTLGATSHSWYRRQGQSEGWSSAPAPSQAVGEPVQGEWSVPFSYTGTGLESPVEAPQESTEGVGQDVEVDPSEDTPAESGVDSFEAEMMAAFERSAPPAPPEEALPPVPRLGHASLNQAPRSRHEEYVDPLDDEVLSAFLEGAQTTSTRHEDTETGYHLDATDTYDVDWEDEAPLDSGYDVDEAPSATGPIEGVEPGPSPSYMPRELPPGLSGGAKESGHEDELDDDFLKFFLRDEEK